MSAPLRLLPYQMAIGVGSASVGGVIALLPELRKTFAASDAAIGLIVGVGFAASFLSQLLLAPQADRGRARAMIRLGLAVAAAALAWMALASSLAEIVAARAALGAAGGVMLPAIRRVVATTDPLRVGENLGRLASFEIGGFVLGPAVSALLAEFGGLRLAFGFFAVLLVLFVPFTVHLPDDVGAKDVVARMAFDLLRQRRVLGALLIVGGYLSTAGVIEAVIPLQLEDRGADTWAIGVGLTALAIPIAITSPFGGRMADRRGAFPVAATAITAAIGVEVLLGFVPGMLPLLAILAVVGAIDGIGFPAGQTLVSRSVPEHRVAAAQGLLGAFEVGLAGLIAVPAAALYDAGGARLVWPLSSTWMLVLVASGFALYRSARPPVVARHSVPEPETA